MKRRRKKRSTLPEKAYRFLLEQAETVAKIIARRRDRAAMTKRYKLACRAAGPRTPTTYWTEPRPKLRPLPEIDRPVRRNRQNEKLMQRHEAYREMQAARAGNFLNPQDASAPGFSSTGIVKPRSGPYHRRPTREFTPCPVCGTPVTTRRLAKHMRKVHAR